MITILTILFSRFFLKIDEIELGKFILLVLADLIAIQALFIAILIKLYGG